ncbi:MAG: hypothetical protein ABIM64_04020 [candidate division WOR-3 bacterium]
MEKQRILKLNKKRIFLVFLLLPLFVFPYILPESYDSEYIVDQFCSDFDINIFNDLIKKDNFVMISGGCYNVEQLSIKSFLGLKIPLMKSLNFELFNFYYDDFEFHNKIFEYGLTYRFRDFFGLGFLANPTFYKKDSDLTFHFDFKGFNTENRFSLTLENFDNNYSHKNWNENIIDKPRIYENNPYILSLYSKGELKKIEFLTFYRKKLFTREKHYFYDEVLDSFLYTFSVDTSYDYIFSQIFYNDKKEKNLLSTGFRLTMLNLSSSFFDFTDTIEELDSRIYLSFYFSYKKNVNRLSFFYEKGYRELEQVFEKETDLLYFGYTFSKNIFDISGGQLISNIKRFDSDTVSYNSFQTRFILSLKIRLGENSYLIARKGFETDYRDIQKGGKYFFYDKGYIQFYSNFDPFIKRE